MDAPDEKPQRWGDEPPPKHPGFWWRAVYLAVILIGAVILEFHFRIPFQRLLFGMLTFLVGVPLGLAYFLGVILFYWAMHVRYMGHVVYFVSFIVLPILSYAAFWYHFVQTRKAPTRLRFLLLMILLVVLTSCGLAGCTQVLFEPIGMQY